MFDPLRFKTRLLVYAAAAFALGIGGASAAGWSRSAPAAAVTQVPQLTDAEIQPALDLSEAFVNIADAVTPGVIRIEAERPPSMASGNRFNLPFPEEFRRFFDGPDQDDEPSDLPPQTAGGSGFIVTLDGYVLTNDHVVGDATAIRVYLQDGREFEAELVGTDPTTDVAVIKINEEEGDLPTLSLGRSADLRVGEWVLAVGNPGFGGGRSLEYTVTSGIVSAIGRGLELIRRELQQDEAWQERSQFAIEDFIQTDAVINPGNSGGPMVNLRGQVVGINTAIASRTGYYQGYGFAIPVDLAKRIMEDLVEFGEVRRAYLGVAMRPVSAVDAELYGLPRPMGALIQQTVPGSPAATAGLSQEDVIVSVNGVTVNRPSQLQLLIAQRRPGDEVSIGYYRNGEEQEARVRLDQAPLGAEPAPEPEPEVSSQERIGIDVTPLDEEAAESLGYESGGGVVIAGVSPPGPAGRAGVRPGMRLMEINRTPVETVEDVDRILAAIETGAIVSLRLGLPDGSPRIINIRIP